MTAQGHLEGEREGGREGGRDRWERVVGQQ